MTGGVKPQTGAERLEVLKIIISSAVKRNPKTMRKPPNAEQAAKLRERNRRFREEHPEYHKEWCKRNKDRVSEYKRTYANRHKEQIREYNRLYRQRRRTLKTD